MTTHSMTGPARLEVRGLDPSLVRSLLAAGIDAAGAPVEPFIDDEGGWPLRCCLTDSRPGDHIAVVAVCPFRWRSAHAATGPVVVHVEPCDGHVGGVPQQFERRRQVVRAFGRDGGRDHTIVHDLNRIVEPGQGLAVALAEVLDDPRVEFVHCHNVLAGCFSFEARRAEA